MSVEVPPETELRRLSKGLINLQDHYYFGGIMDVDVRRNNSNNNNTPPNPTSHLVVEGRQMEYRRRSYSQGQGHGQGGHSRRMFPAASYFSLESLLLLICLTASLLILPLILPPLPPPPFMLLLLPIGILALLMILAFMPSNVRGVTYTYV